VPSPFCSGLCHSLLSMVTLSQNSYGVTYHSTTKPAFYFMECGFKKCYNCNIAIRKYSNATSIELTEHMLLLGVLHFFGYDSGYFCAALEENSFDNGGMLCFCNNLC
jgi:hypothetical protein